MNWDISLFTIVHQNCACIHFKVVWAWICTVSIDTRNTVITTILNLKGTTTGLIWLALSVIEVS